jgi:hypothetical protein
LDSPYRAHGGQRLPPNLRWLESARLGGRLLVISSIPRWPLLLGAMLIGNPFSRYPSLPGLLWLTLLPVLAVLGLLGTASGGWPTTRRAGVGPI